VITYIQLKTEWVRRQKRKKRKLKMEHYKNKVEKKDETECKGKRKVDEE
jgi:hypothetical protein